MLSIADNDVGWSMVSHLGSPQRGTILCAASTSSSVNFSPDMVLPNFSEGFSSEINVRL